MAQRRSSESLLSETGILFPVSRRTSRFEYLLFFTLQKRKGITSRAIPTADFRGTVDNIYQAPFQRHNPYPHLHGATFPLHLPLWLMQTFDATAGSGYDPFLGTGTTLIAAEELGRCSFGLEIEPAYCEVVLERWERLSGQRARLANRQPLL